MPGNWPLRSFLELGALPGAVPCARLHTRQLAWEWGLAELGQDAALVTSELVTNAVAAAQAVQPVVQPVWPVRLWLQSDAAQIAILVWDPSHQPPVPTQADAFAESGRGLLLVETISHRWGWYPAGDTIGKVVWAVCALEAPDCIPGSAGRNLEGIPGSMALPGAERQEGP